MSEWTSVVGKMGFIGRWFGFEGWKQVSSSQTVLQVILWRIGFAIGLATCIISYVIAVGGDPPGEALLGILIFWFLCYQALLNFIFVQGSR
jgi:hypothetical protein